MDLIRKLIERRKALMTELETMNTTEEGDIRALTAEDDELFKAKAAEVRQLDERIEELRDAEVREAAAAKFAVPLGTVAVGDGVVHEPNPVYRRGDHSTSFFKDLAAFQLNTNIGTLTLSEAKGRLAASQETRAGDMTTVAGAGGEMAPPLWQVEDFVALARAGRVTADLCQNEVLPSGVSSINLPKVASGVTVAVQATQNSALSDTAMTTTSVSSGITTVGGKQIVSMQLLQQSGIPFDKVILQDLAKAYAVQVDTQVLYGTNANGQLRGLVGVANNSAFTSATPAVASVTNANSLYYTLTKAAAAVQAGIFEPANAIVMHPNRWAWILGAVDSSARPFVIPQGGNFNPVGTHRRSGRSGRCRLLRVIPRLHRPEHLGHSERGHEPGRDLHPAYRPVVALRVAGAVREFRRNIRGQRLGPVPRPRVPGVHPAPLLRRRAVATRYWAGRPVAVPPTTTKEHSP